MDRITVADKTVCRVGCGACCIAPSISSFIPGMPNGKPAGVRCLQLSDDNLCLLFESAERPLVCKGFKPSREMCGNCTEDALAYLSKLENATAPEKERRNGKEAGL